MKPIISEARQASMEIRRSIQLIGAPPSNAERAALITPVIGFMAKTHEYFPAMLGG